jgi:hypothetical protein
MEAVGMGLKENGSVLMFSVLIDMGARGYKMAHGLLSFKQT